jgi:hypothetical protein
MKYTHILLILLRAWNDLILGWLSSFMTKEVDATGGQSLYPLHRCKTLHRPGL